MDKEKHDCDVAYCPNCSVEKIDEWEKEKFSSLSVVKILIEGAVKLITILLAIYGLYEITIAQYMRLDLLADALAEVSVVLGDLSNQIRGR